MQQEQSSGQYSQAIFKGALSVDNGRHDLTPIQKQFFQNHTELYYAKFCQTVAASRRMNMKDVVAVATGATYLPGEAHRLGLIDGVKLGLHEFCEWVRQEVVHDKEAVIARYAQRLPTYGIILGFFDHAHVNNMRKDSVLVSREVLEKLKAEVSPSAMNISLVE